jgi:hypothetical protein
MALARARMEGTERLAELSVVREAEGAAERAGILGGVLKE